MNRRLFTFVSVCVAVVVAMTVSLVGCEDLSPSTTSRTTPSSSVAEVVYVESQPVDLAAVVNLDLAELSDAEKQVLAQQSFVAVGLAPEATAWKFWQVYEDARYRGLPVLITTDSVLNAYHGLFDTLLQRMEEAALFDQAVAMTQSLYSHTYDQWSVATDPIVKAETYLNLIYFAVGSALLDPAAHIPAELQEQVEAELALIEAAAGPAESPNLGYTEDYSQYKPRGHYTRSERLENYFRAMVWYGHTGFFINPRNPDVTAEEAESLTRRAILISAALVGEARESWTAIYEATGFLVGRADDLSLSDVGQVLIQVFGTAQPLPDDLADAGKIASVREALNLLPAPKIQSAVVPDLGSESGEAASREETERSFRVMGQRFIPDSYALQQLVWAYVGTEDNKRSLPMGLDVMTVLGSDQAYALETEFYDQDQHTGWDSQIEKVKREFLERSPDLWPAGLYTGWLDSLRDVMKQPAESAPPFMRSQAWARKSLNTALGSWTELRHDTILYAKQSVAAEGEGGEAPLSPGYVEPYPAFYSKIAELATAMKEGLDEYGLIDPDAAEKLEDMIWIAETLAAIAEKELAREQLTDEEIALVESYGSELEYLEQFGTTADGLTLSPGAERSPVVADVHSDYVSSPAQALEEATGYPLYLYAALVVDGQLQLFVGASYSYYEFTMPVDQRLTDEEWTQLLDFGTEPRRPPWTDEWIVER
jgi:hypothetical protein